MFYYLFAIVCLLLSKLFSKKTALIMTFGFMILCVVFFGATDSVEFYVISLLPLMTYMFSYMFILTIEFVEGNDSAICIILDASKEKR